MTTEVCSESMKPASQNQQKRGFTLTEIAIVLGIIGLILGAIWVAAGAVYTNMRVSKATTELLQITQGIRSLYATQTTIDTAAAVAETANFINAGIFPSDSVNATNPPTANGPWSNSAILVFSSTDPNAGGVVGDSFEVMFSGLPKSACVNMATTNTGTGRDSGLLSLGYAATKAGAYIAPVATGTAAKSSFPITAAQASGQCTGTTDDLAFVFKLKG